MADPRLTEEHIAGGTPGSPNGQISPTPGYQVQVAADPRKEYVAGAALQWYLNIPHALPWALDDVATDFGPDIYERMMLDPQVRASLNVQKASVLESGINLLPAVSNKEDDGYAQAVALCNDVEDMFDALGTSIEDTLWNMMDAFGLGNRVAEQVFDLGATRSGKTQYLLQTLAVRPPQSYAFVVDAYNTVLGILGRIPGQPFPVQAGMLLADVQHTPNLLPRSKFAVYSFRPHNMDPRGTSLLRPAFSAWNAKVQLAREYLRYLTQFATPSLLGFTAPDAEPTASTDATGNLVETTPEQVMLVALQAFQNGTAAAFPNGAQVQPIEMSGEGLAFLNAFHHYDTQIIKSILGQTLATEESQHQTRAATGSHKDILDTLTRQIRRSLERMIRKDVLEIWLRLNGLEKLIPLLPLLTLGQTEDEDKSAMMVAIAQLRRADYLHRSQFSEIDALLGLPVRTPPDADSADEHITVQVKENGPPLDESDDGTAPAHEPTQQEGHETTTSPGTDEGQPGEPSTSERSGTH